jgi:hypothetical protein
MAATDAQHLSRMGLSPALPSPHSSKHIPSTGTRRPARAVSMHYHRALHAGGSFGLNEQLFMAAASTGSVPLRAVRRLQPQPLHARTVSCSHPLLLASGMPGAHGHALDAAGHSPPWQLQDSPMPASAALMQAAGQVQAQAFAYDALPVEGGGWLFVQRSAHECHAQLPAACAADAQRRFNAAWAADLWRASQCGAGQAEHGQHHQLHPPSAHCNHSSSRHSLGSAGGNPRRLCGTTTRTFSMAAGSGHGTAEMPHADYLAPPAAPLSPVHKMHSLVQVALQSRASMRTPTAGSPDLDSTGSWGGAAITRTTPADVCLRSAWGGLSSADKDSARTSAPAFKAASPAAPPAHPTAAAGHRHFAGPKSFAASPQPSLLASCGPPLSSAPAAAPSPLRRHQDAATTLPSPVPPARLAARPPSAASLSPPPLAAATTPPARCQSVCARQQPHAGPTTTHAPHSVGAQASGQQTAHASDPARAQHRSTQKQGGKRAPSFTKGRKGSGRQAGV